MTVWKWLVFCFFPELMALPKLWFWYNMPKKIIHDVYYVCYIQMHTGGFLLIKNIPRKCRVDWKEEQHEHTHNRVLQLQARCRPWTTMALSPSEIIQSSYRWERGRRFNSLTASRFQIRAPLTISFCAFWWIFEEPLSLSFIIKNILFLPVSIF